jgi:hypothetical protein
MKESCASTLLEQGEENYVAISVPIKPDEFALNNAGCGIIPMENVILRTLLIAERPSVALSPNSSGC